MTSAVLSGAVEKGVQEFSTDKWGRRTHCIGCGKRLQHPQHGGRPRIHCGRRACELKRRQARKAAVRERWTKADKLEAARLWKCRCAICGGVFEDRWFYVLKEHAPLPTHTGCAESPLPQRAREWLSRCKPGCPLPNPFAGDRP